MKRSNYESGIMGLFPVPRTPWERRLHVVGQLPLYLFILLLCDSRFGIIPEGVRTPLLLICGIPGSIGLFHSKNGACSDMVGIPQKSRSF